MMRTIETMGVVAADHTITLKLPDDVPEGNCQIVVVIQDEMEPARKPGPLTANWETFDIGPWPEGFTASREQLYGDDGR